MEAVSALLEGGEDVSIIAQNLIEFWAVATRPLQANGFGWDIQQATAQIGQLLNQFPLLDDTPAVFRNWLQLVTWRGISGKRVHDARLVAVMGAHGVTHLLTFNTSDFEVYRHITLVHPDAILSGGNA